MPFVVYDQFFFLEKIGKKTPPKSGIPPLLFFFYFNSLSCHQDRDKKRQREREEERQPKPNKTKSTQSCHILCTILYVVGIYYV